MKFKTILLFLALIHISAIAAEETTDFSPPPDEQQLPHAMHSKMKTLPHITVGRDHGDIIGTDNRALQAAVDYIAGLGGGTVEIAPGEYLMHDSLHLRSNVTVKGAGQDTILKKAPASTSPLALDGDFGEQQITLKNPEGFHVGYGVAITDDHAGGFHTTVARITGRNGNTFSIDKPLMADCMVSNNARTSTSFPVISGYNLEGARIVNLTIDGNKQENPHLNGCRGAGIFLYRAFGTVIKGCTVKNYNGDGISFQQSNDVKVENCISEGNASLGIHPGSGSQRPIVRNCIARKNGTDGLFLCWRVRHGLFEHNTLEANGRFGISIGHKDSDNLLQDNLIRLNAKNGIFFRNESQPMSPHRNKLIRNIIENNSTAEPGAAIRIRGYPNDLLFADNIIRDTRKPDSQTQVVGILIEENAGKIRMEKNKISAKTRVVDKRTSSSKGE